MGSATNTGQRKENRMKQVDERIMSALEEVVGSHVKLLGPDTVREIGNAFEEGRTVDDILKKLSTGEAFGLDASFKIICEIIPLLLAIVQIYDLLAKHLGRKPTTAEVKAKVAEEKLSEMSTSATVKGKLDNCISAISASS